MDPSFRPCDTLKVYNRRRKLVKNKDWISALSDDILIIILSFLTTEEAVRTSVLSKRWRHIWAYVPLLIFDASKILARCVDNYVTQKMERDRYLRCVDHVVSSHKTLTVDEIRLRFYLFEYNKDSIDKWVRFAAEKKVKRLEFNFGCYWGLGSLHPYNFPSLNFLNALTSFNLDCVNVTGEVLESVIHNCKGLEFLSVTRSVVLLALKVVGESLKSLRILECKKLKELEIYAPNLVSLDYRGLDSCMPFKCTPRLTELTIEGSIEKPPLMGSITHHIKVLKLDIAEIKPVSNGFPECTRLKTLDITYDPQCEEDLFHVSLLIMACPLLHKLVIQLRSSVHDENGKIFKKKEESWCHNHLKIVEIVGFDVSALRFATYLIEGAVSLENLIIDTQPPYELREPGEPVVFKKITRSQIQATELLTTTLKPWTELEFR